MLHESKATKGHKLSLQENLKSSQDLCKLDTLELV